MIHLLIPKNILLKNKKKPKICFVSGDFVISIVGFITDSEILYYINFYWRVCVCVERNIGKKRSMDRVQDLPSLHWFLEANHGKVMHIIIYQIICRMSIARYIWIWKKKKIQRRIKFQSKSRKMIVVLNVPLIYWVQTFHSL